MSAVFGNGTIIDAILILMVIEGLMLWRLHARSGRGLPLPALLPILASGAALMLAVRAALTGARWEVVSAFLVAALVAHLADLASRWR